MKEVKEIVEITILYDKKKIEKQTWEEEFYSAIKTFIISVLSGTFYAYIGYSFCVDNEYNLVKGVVFGFFCRLSME